MTKEPLTPNQFFLIVNGPSCGGKSSVSDVLCEKYGRIFKGKSDVIKWLISDYTAVNDRGVLLEMTVATMRVALSHGLSVLKEGAHWAPEKYVAMAKEFNIPLFIANVEAPWDILVERFEHRIEKKKLGAKIANTDPVRFKELYDSYNLTKMETSLSFDSSKQSPEEIASTIATTIQNYFDNK